MPRGVAKAKDGVEKKGKKVVKKDDVRRSRKMRGGGIKYFMIKYRIL